MRRAAGALVLLLASLAAHSDPATAPKPEQLSAAADSPFVKRLLAQRFTPEHHSTMVAVKTLEYTRNVDMARLLGRAEQRRALAQITGEAHELPATFGAAIEQERGLPPLDTALGNALGRISIDWVSSAPPDAPTPDRPAERVRDGMWIASDPQGLTRVWVLLSIRNGLPVPIGRVSVVSGSGDNAKRLSCEAKQGTPRSIEPGEERLRLCWADDRTERIGPLRDAFAAPKSGPLRAAYAEGPGTLVFIESGVYWEEHHDDGTREALEALAAASCQDKATCPAVERAQQQRVEEDRKQRAPSEAFSTGAWVALLVAALAAALVRPRPAPGFGMTIVAVLVIACAAFTVATGYYSLQPGASIAWMIPLAIVYYGQWPFFIALIALAASLAGGRITRLRAFAATFGLSVAVLAWITVAQQH